MSLFNSQVSSKSQSTASQERPLIELDRPPHSGDRCPICQRGSLDYDGLLDLACQECGFAFSGCFT